ncbi:MAG: UDP-2,3-diacylglucosamine diphosphatase [Prevotellaceae bacterium]|jgi:UDP-2,3-diacylglucosamine hydrolase|nr:UDP-2,3-diacylglucosamine diphosphatase [Prevotellaceae bacterium]
MQKHTYFLSDMHLGLPLYNPAEREKKVVRFLDSVKNTAGDIYLLGDVFDFWWEYKYVVPKGYVRFLGKLAELTDSGVNIHFFVGNHDLWIKNYLAYECSVKIYHKPEEITIGNKIFFLAHGDRLGNGIEVKPTMLQRVFANRFLQWLYSTIHPRWGLAFGYTWSKHSRLSKEVSTPWRGKDELLFRLATKMAERSKVDYFIFGHRHTPVQMDLPNRAKLLILSDWITGCTYAEFDGNNIELKEFKG